MISLIMNEKTFCKKVLQMTSLFFYTKTPFASLLAPRREKEEWG